MRIPSSFFSTPFNANANLNHLRNLKELNQPNHSSSILFLSCLRSRILSRLSSLYSTICFRPTPTDPRASHRHRVTHAMTMSPNQTLVLHQPNRLKKPSSLFFDHTIPSSCRVRTPRLFVSVVYSYTLRHCPVSFRSVPSMHTVSFFPS